LNRFLTLNPKLARANILLFTWEKSEIYGFFRGKRSRKWGFLAPKLNRFLTLNPKFARANILPFTWEKSEISGFFRGKRSWKWWFLTLNPQQKLYEPMLF
jgi:hypothetical protein